MSVGQHVKVRSMVNMPPDGTHIDDHLQLSEQ